jgi:hypothetical protein
VVVTVIWLDNVVVNEIHQEEQNVTAQNQILEKRVHPYSVTLVVSMVTCHQTVDQRTKQ